MLSAMTEVSQVEDYSNSGKIYVDDSMGTMMSSMSSTVKNDLVSFKKHLLEHYDTIKDRKGLGASLRNSQEGYRGS